MKRIIKFLLNKLLWVAGILIGMGLISDVVLAAVTAQLERDSIHADQTVRLIVESDNADSTSQPDFTVLDQNFNVLGTSTSKNVSIVNGVQTSRRQWVIELEPRAEGSFTIPSIRIDGQESPPLRLTVFPREPLRSGQLPDIFVEMEAKPLEAYVQQQISLVVRLYLGVKILNGTLSEPAPEDTDIRRLGNDVQYESTEGNRRFQVIERRYALFPGKSGELRVPAVRFNGHAEDAASSSNQIFSGLFNQGKRVKATSEPVILNINPPEPTFTGRSWLPAKLLEISDEAPIDKEIQVGQPVTRQIQIRSVGLTAEQLPEIEFQGSPDFKQYPDKTIRESHQDGNDIIGLVNRSIAVIPMQAGSIALPSIQLNWWNTVTGEMETATLPEKKVTVIPGPAASAPVDTIKPREYPVAEITRSEEQTAPISSTRNHIWMLISAVLLAGWIVTILYFVRKSRGKSVTRTSVNTIDADHETSRDLLVRIKQACKTNDPRETRRLLQVWFRSHRPDSTSQTLDEISRWLQSAELKNEFIELDRYLYAETQRRYGAADSDPARDSRGSTWSGNTLYQLLSTLPALKPDKTRPSNKALPPLYPQWQ